jgi:hypothetical protein
MQLSFDVGTQERHRVVFSFDSVRIEKERKVLFAGFRPQTCRGYVDGQLVAEHTE